MLPTMEPTLLPGTHVLRRGPGQLQAGLVPERSVVAPGDPSPPALAALHAGAADRGLSVPDAGILRRALPPQGDGTPWRRHSVAALGRRHPGTLGEVLARRHTHVVEVHTFGHELDTEVLRDVDELCDRAGLRRPTRIKPGPGPREATTSVVLLLGVGEPSRDRVDPWVRSGTPHLLVRWTEGDAVVGPFVVPGSTPCLRCIDAHHTEHDPAWPLLVEQYARLSRGDRPDGVPEPVDPTMVTLAVAWAVADLATYAEGGRPTTLGATLRVSPRMQEIETTRWLPHPACGCDWG